MRQHQHTTFGEAKTTPVQVSQWAQALTDLHIRIAPRFAQSEPIAGHWRIHKGSSWRKCTQQ